MSEPTTPEPTSSEPTIESLQADLATWKGHARRWEERAKENGSANSASEQAIADLTARLDEVTTRLTEADRVAEDAARNALRIRIASAHGIDTTPGEDGAPSVADLLLTGADEAAMTAQAAAIGARSTGPKPNPAQGKSGEAQVSSKDSFIEALGAAFE